MRGDHDRAVLDERAVVDEIGDVLARRSATDRASPGDGIGACRIEPDRVTGLHLGEVGPHTGEVGGDHVDRCLAGRTTPGSTEATAAPAITVAPASTSSPTTVPSHGDSMA